MSLLQTQDKSRSGEHVWEVCSAMTEHSFEYSHIQGNRWGKGATTINKTTIEHIHNILHCDAILHECDARRPVLPLTFSQHKFIKSIFFFVCGVDLPYMVCCSVKYLWCLLSTDFYRRLGQLQLYEHTSHRHSTPFTPKVKCSGLGLRVQSQCITAFTKMLKRERQGRFWIS